MINSRRVICSFISILILASLIESCLLDDYPCDGEYKEYEAIVYDTFALMDTNSHWNNDTNINKITFISPQGIKETFEIYARGELFERKPVERVPFDYENCINSGLNYVLTEMELERWNSTYNASLLNFQRKVRVKNIDECNIDSIHNSYIGESIEFYFSGTYQGEFYYPINYWEPSSQIIELIDTLYLNGNIVTNVIHIYRPIKPEYVNGIYIKGVYIKWRVGILSYYNSKDEHWYLEM